MKLKFTALAVAVALAPMSALAGGMIDGFYSYQSVKEKDALGGAKANQNGYGIRAAANLNENIMLTGLYQEGPLKFKGGGGKDDVTETRVGIMGSHDYQGVKLLAGIERVSYNIKVRGVGAPVSFGQSGYVAKVGGQIGILEGLTAHLTVGYVDLSQRTRGYEVEAGARYMVLDNVSAFVDYRYTDTKNKAADVKLEQQLVRVGAGYHF